MNQLRGIGAVLIVLAGGPASAYAQGLELVTPERVKFGVSGVLAFPTGDFGDFVDVGGGANLSLLFNADPDGHFGIRLDGTFLGYGHERITRPLSNTIQRILVDVHTNNWIAMLGVGPQLTLGTGPVKPYVYGTIGFSYFATVSHVSGSSDFDDFASTTNFDDVTFTATGSAGLQIQLSRGHRPVSLDLSAQTARSGLTEYLRPGSIQERPDGSVFIVPIRSETNLVAFKLGVSIGIG